MATKGINFKLEVKTKGMDKLRELDTSAEELAAGVRPKPEANGRLRLLPGSIELRELRRTGGFSALADEVRRRTAVHMFGIPPKLFGLYKTGEVELWGSRWRVGGLDWRERRAVLYWIGEIER